MFIDMNLDVTLLAINMTPRVDFHLFELFFFEKNFF